jgi:hypothetical protein
MNSVQESKQELEAAIRYAENAISSAKTTIESMEFRQEMAKKQSSEQTGREEALTKQVTEFKAQMALLKERIADMQSDMVGDAAAINTLKEEREMLEKNVQYLRDENERLKREKEASSGPCGCQAYRDLEERATMPVIPKAVAIAIFREGVAHGVSNACDELDNSDAIEINESEYCGDFEVSFSKYIDLSEHLDLDWMRDKVGDYDEASVIEALKNLCADKEFECRIHGVDDQEEKKND